MSLPSRLLGANPSIQVSTLLSGSLSTPSAKGAFVIPGSYYQLGGIFPASNASEYEVTSIPSTYQHLMVKVQVKTTKSDGDTNFGMRFNGDTATNYGYVNRVGDSGSLAALYNYNQNKLDWGYTYGIYQASTLNTVNMTFLIPNYSSTTQYKTIIAHGMVAQREGSPGGGAWVQGMYYHSLSPISSILIFDVNGNPMRQYSRISVYGIAGS
jgi:hypothetical protein